MSDKLPKLPEPKLTPMDIRVGIRAIYFPDSIDLDGTGMYGILPGYYGEYDIPNMLRVLKNNPDAIQYIADMLE